MFTGLIEATAQILEKGDASLLIERPSIFTDIHTGASISVSGVCLSVAKLTQADMSFDISDETWSKTMLGDLQEGHHVNLERALRVNGRLEGHIVQGHVDGVGEVIAVEEARVIIHYPSSLREFIVEKGSIALNGVSLTVASKNNETFSVVVIPLTKEKTTLATLQRGERVNVEVDVLGKYIRGGERSH